MPYLPQWRARLAAEAALGNSAFIWTKRKRFFVGLRFPNGRKIALGEGSNWQEALDAAERNAPAADADKLA